LSEYEEIRTVKPVYHCTGHRRMKITKILSATLPLFLLAGCGSQQKLQQRDAATPVPFVTNELMRNAFIPLINKGGGAGMQVTACTQTLSDIEARIGNAAKTAQVQGNFNNMIMLRVRENRTAERLTTQLPQVKIYTKALVSGHQDSADVSTGLKHPGSRGDGQSATAGAC
jgi:hypothetical protein